MKWKAVFSTQAKYTNLVLLFTRVGLGLTMLLGHGLSKWRRVVSGEEIRFADPLGVGQEVSLYLATGAEFFCSIFVILGLFTRLALVPLIITMGVVVLVVKSGDPLQEYEKALLYLMAFSALLFLGPGKFSLDAILLKTKTSKK